jgi:hypothetical protein
MSTDKKQNDHKLETYLNYLGGGLGVAGAHRFIQGGGTRGIDTEAAPRVQVMSAAEGSFGNQAKGLESMLKAEGIEATPYSWTSSPEKERLGGLRRLIDAPSSDASIYLGHNSFPGKDVADIGKMKYRINSDFREGNFISPQLLYHGGESESTADKIKRKIIETVGGDRMRVREDPKSYDRFFTPGHPSIPMPEEYQGKLPTVMTGNIPTRDVFGQTPFKEKDWSPGAKINAVLTTGGGNAMPQVFDELPKEHAGLLPAADRPGVYNIQERLKGQQWRDYDVEKKFFLDDIMENLRKTHGEDNVNLKFLTGLGKADTWPDNREFIGKLRKYVTEHPEGQKRFKGLQVLDHIDDMPGAFADAHYVFATPGSTVAEVMRMPGEHVPKMINVLPNDKPEGYMKHFPVNAAETERMFPGAKTWDTMGENRGEALSKILNEGVAHAPGRTTGYESDFSQIGKTIREDVKSNKVKNIKILAALGGASAGALLLSQAVKMIRKHKERRALEGQTKHAGVAFVEELLAKEANWLTRQFAPSQHNIEQQHKKDMNAGVGWASNTDRDAYFKAKGVPVPAGAPQIHEATQTPRVDMYSTAQPPRRQPQPVAAQKPVMGGPGRTPGYNEIPPMMREHVWNHNPGLMSSVLGTQMDKEKNQSNLTNYQHEQDRLAQQYPQLAVAGSPMNQAFITQAKQMGYAGNPQVAANADPSWLSMAAYNAHNQANPQPSHQQQPPQTGASVQPTAGNFRATAQPNVQSAPAPIPQQPRTPQALSSGMGPATSVQAPMPQQPPQQQAPPQMSQQGNTQHQPATQPPPMPAPGQPVNPKAPSADYKGIMGSYNQHSSLDQKKKQYIDQLLKNNPGMSKHQIWADRGYNSIR